MWYLSYCTNIPDPFCAKRRIEIIFLKPLDKSLKIWYTIDTVKDREK